MKLLCFFCKSVIQFVKETLLNDDVVNLTIDAVNKVCMGLNGSAQQEVLIRSLYNYSA